MLSDDYEPEDDSTAEGSGGAVDDENVPSDIGSLIDDSSLTANDVENGVSAEGGDQTDLSRRTVLPSADGLITGESIEDMSAVASWILTQGVARSRTCHRHNGRRTEYRPKQHRLPCWCCLKSNGGPKQSELVTQALNILSASSRCEKQIYPVIFRIVCRLSVILASHPINLWCPSDCLCYFSDSCSCYCQPTINTPGSLRSESMARWMTVGVTDSQRLTIGQCLHPNQTFSRLCNLCDKA